MDVFLASAMSNVNNVTDVLGRQSLYGHLGFVVQDFWYGFDSVWDENHQEGNHHLGEDFLKQTFSSCIQQFQHVYPRQNPRDLITF